MSMFKKVKTRNKGIRTTLARANFMSLIHQRPLPPGNMAIQLDEVEAANRISLIEMSEKIGPIYKGRAWDAFWIYVVGLPRCREIMRQHESDMRPVTIDTTPLFAKGLLRQMEGDDHRIYRSQLGLAMKSMDFTETLNEFAKDTTKGLAKLAAESGTTPILSKDLHHFFSGLVFDTFTRCIFGIDPRSDKGAKLREVYHELGGNGLVWSPGMRQKKALTSISGILRDFRTEQSDLGKNSIFGRMQAQGPVDDVMLGNLIYMVEMGRYDTTAFLLWLSWFAVMNPDWTDRIADEDDTALTSEAFVMESLRLEQSERLVRRVQRDFVAEGFLFPKGAMVRFCIWESHKLPDAHDCPFDFDPTRFLDTRPSPDRYSPFGADKHQCPFGTFSIDFGAAFVKSIAKEYRMSSDSSRSSVRGLYHWEPEKAFSLILAPRRGAGP